jgi:hypothetical protein
VFDRPAGILTIKGKRPAMPNKEGFISLFSQGLKGPRSGRYLLLAGFLVMILGCAGVVVSNLATQGTDPGSTAAFIIGLLLFLSFLILSAGLVISVIGSVVHLLQNIKGTPR